MEYFWEAALLDASDLDVDRCDLRDRAQQLAEWLESEFRVLTVDDVSEDERERMEERARTARELLALI